MAAERIIAGLGGGLAERESAYGELDGLASQAMQSGGSGMTHSSVTVIHCGGLEGELEDEGRLEKLFGRFGTVVAVSLRVRREGTKVSWALVSFRTLEEARSALEGTPDLSAQYAGLVTRTVDEVQAVHSTGGMGEVMRKHMHARLQRRLQDQSLADVALLCTPLLCDVMCKDASVDHCMPLRDGPAGGGAAIARARGASTCSGDS